MPVRTVSSPSLRARAGRVGQVRVPLAVWLLALITLGAGLLRFIGIASQSFWLDEYLTWDFARHPIGDLREMLRLEPHPPLYFLSAWGWSHFFGDTEAGLRSFSALLGTATVPLVYAAAVTRLSRTAALLAALLVAVSPFAVWYSQEARPYAMLGAFCALSLVCLLHALRSPRGWAWGWAVASALALATHYFAGFLIALEALWLLRVHGWRTVRGPAAFVLVTELLLVAYLVTGDTDLVDWVRTTPLPERLERVPIEFLTGLQSVHLLTDAAIRFWIAAAIVVAGLAAAIAWSSERARALPFLVLGASLIVLPLAIAIIKPSSDYVLPRYLIAALGPLLIAVAAGLSASRARVVGPLAGIALAGILLSLTISIATRSEYQRSDWRSVGEKIGATEVPRAVVTRTWVHSLPLQAYVPGLALVYKERETAGLEAGNRERAQIPLEVSEVVVLIGPGRKPDGALVPGLRLTGWRVLGGAVLATYSSPRPVVSSPGELSTGVRRLYGRPKDIWDSPVVYFQPPA